jgi:CHAT domain-containing protein
MILHFPTFKRMRLYPLVPRVDAAVTRRVALVVLISLVCTLPNCSRKTDAALGQAAELLEALSVAPRLSIARSFRACSEAVPDGGTIPRLQCPALRPSEQDRLNKLITGSNSYASDQGALHTLALVELVSEDPRGTALDRSISNLRRAAGLTDRPAPVLADLSAALAIRAERTQAPRDLLEAYETAEQALDHDVRNLGALYNRALALDRFGLVDEAARDWAAYLAVDSTSDWADEARRRRRLALAVQPPPRPAADASLVEYAGYAAADPEQAREMGMDELLPEWGEAVAAGNPADAADRLRRAAALGEALERRPGGDASLAEAVRAIGAANGNRAVTEALARAHREYAGGRAALEALDFTFAAQRFASAEAGASASPILAAWARVYTSIALIQQGNWNDAEPILREAASADSSLFPALIARALWTTGRTLGHGERWETGLTDALRSAELFSRAGERENEGSALNVLASIRFVLGEPDSGYAALHRSLDRMRRYRASPRLHNLLASSAASVSDDGLQGAALRILDEDVRVADRTRHPFFAAEARLRRARSRAWRGHHGAATRDIRATKALADRITVLGARAWVQAELAETEAALSIYTDPGAATRMLDSVAAFFTTLPFRALPALVGGAEARLATGDRKGAAERLARAVRLLEQRRDSIRMEPRRAAIFDAARTVIDRVVLLELAEGRVDEALGLMDRARGSLASAAAPVAGDRDGVRAVPGEVALEYARVADTLLVWTVARSGVEVYRTVLDTVRLARTIEALERNLQRGASETEVRPALSLLYEWLVRPVEARLGPGPLVVVADGEIAAVPFAALYDTRRRRYLVQDHPLRFAVSLREARRRPTAHPAVGVLLVADPAYDTREHPLLQRLEHARQEVNAISGGYPGATLLEGENATRLALEAGLAKAGVVHFAGHAVFDDQRPERSYLVLAPHAGPSGAGRITAAELAKLNLSGVRLIVLSACRSVRSGRSRAGGFTGLAGALLAAGAGAAIGSTWEVDDRSTAALMEQFHHAYSTRRDGPAALRTAQLALLTSRDTALHSPAAWAGFRYAGR